MRQAGRYLPEYREVRSQAPNFLDFCYTPDLAVEATLQPLRRYQPDAAILFCDILVIPDALGQQVAFVEGEGPVLEPVRSVVDLDDFDVERIDDHLAPVFETVKRLTREIPAETALIGFAGSPWTVAVYMVEGRGGTDGSVIRKWAGDAPEEFSRLIDILVDATSRYLSRQVEHGAEILQLFDSWSGILNQEEFDRWVIEPTREIVARLNHAFPDIPVIGFPRNSGPFYEDYVKQTGVSGVSMDQTVDLAWAAKILQPCCTVQGNLDNEILLAGGEALDRDVTRILETLSPGPFIFNLGHGVLPPTPPEHVGRVAELVRGWRRTK
jgi:uroporphyrinogen decarboxylase